MIGPSICFPEWYFRWDLYSQNVWCQQSAQHIEEPYWSHHHSLFVYCFLLSYFRKHMLNDIFICGYQYLLHPNPIKCSQVSLMWHMIYTCHSTCYSYYKYMILWDTWFIGNCKWGITTHGINICLPFFLFFPIIIYI